MTYGIREHVSGNGRFTTTYTFGLGDPSDFQPFWFQIASLPMGNYPYAPAASRRVTVIVGGDPSPPAQRRPRHRRRHKLQDKLALPAPADAPSAVHLGREWSLGFDGQSSVSPVSSMWASQRSAGAVIGTAPWSSAWLM